MENTEMWRTDRVIMHLYQVNKIIFFKNKILNKMHCVQF